MYSYFKEDISGADLADMQLISKVKEIRFSLWIIDNYSNFPWVVLLKDKNGITITKASQKLLYEPWFLIYIDMFYYYWYF